MLKEKTQQGDAARPSLCFVLEMPTDGTEPPWVTRRTIRKAHTMMELASAAAKKRPPPTEANEMLEASRTAPSQPPVTGADISPTLSAVMDEEEPRERWHTGPGLESADSELDMDHDLHMDVDYDMGDFGAEIPGDNENEDPDSEAERLFESDEEVADGTTSSDESDSTDSDSQSDTMGDPVPLAEGEVTFESLEELVSSIDIHSGALVELRDITDTIGISSASFYTFGSSLSATTMDPLDVDLVFALDTAKMRFIRLIERLTVPKDLPHKPASIHSFMSLTEKHIQKIRLKVRFAEQENTSK